MSGIMNQQPYRITYEFRLKDGIKKTFRIRLDPVTISFLPGEQIEKTIWMRLGYLQCECCPLEEKDFPYCPIAVNMGKLCEEFKNIPSFDKCVVRCTTIERTYTKKTSIMEGLASVFGIIMATSDCPVMSFFKPMARFHLPFSTIQETVFRVASIHLLKQYFECRDAGRTEFDLESLNEHYRKVRMINEGLMARLSRVVKKDADKNAVNILHSLCQILSREISFSFNSVEYLFKP